jgi:hypothetical protein
MIMSEAAAAAPLDDRMLVTDVVDTLRHGADLPFDPRNGAAPPELMLRLHDLYRRQGIEISDAVLRDGIAAMAEGRFAYAPPRGPLAGLARLYVSRRRWGRPVLAIAVLLAIAAAGYQLGYRPYAAGQTAEAQRQLQQIPGELDALYDEVFEDTKVQTAASNAGDLRDRGKVAAAKGDRAGADAALAALSSLRDTLEASYTVRVVSDDSVKPGFWTFPTNNSAATNYYIVVEAVNEAGEVLTLPITSEDSGTATKVSRWGLRVPESVYDAVMADKRDGSVSQHNLVGIKQDGFTDVDYTVPVLGGALTQW